LPGYEVLDEIHRGGQGVVYRGVQTATGRRVAIKVLLRGVMSTERQRMRFQIESELAARLRHPNIVGIFDRIAIPSGGFALVMELVEGVTLRHWRAPGVTGFSRARGIAAMFAVIADAVHAAHQSGVIHRDLKPSNVMIDGEGNPRVLDFGLAKSIAEDRVKVTQTEDVAWTLAYASPEQVNDPKRVGVRSDVYSLGVMLYEALSGSLPYETMDCALPFAIERICNAAPAPLRAAAARGGIAEVPYELELIVMKTLEKEESQRYESAAALGADLRAWLLGDRVKARPTSLAYALKKAVRRNRLGVAAGLVAMVGLVAGAAMWASSRAGRLAAESAAMDENAASEASRLLLLQLVPATNPEFRTNEDSDARQSIDLFAMRLDAGELLHRPRVELATRSLLADLYESHRLLPEAIEQRRRVVEMRAASGGANELPTLESRMRLAKSLAIADQELPAFSERRGYPLKELRQYLRDSWRREAVEVAEAVFDASGASESLRLQALDVLVDLPEYRTWKEDRLTAEVGRFIGSAGVSQEGPGTARMFEALSRATREKDKGIAAEYAANALAIRLRTQLDEEPEVLEAVRERASFGDLSADHPVMRLDAATLSLVSVLDETASVDAFIELKQDVLGATPDAHSVTSSVLRVAMIHARAEEWDRALRRLEECKLRFERSEHLIPAGPRICLDLMVPIAIRLGDLERAELSRERVERYQTIGNRRDPRYGRALSEHAEIALRRGRFDEVGDRIRAARAVLREQFDQPASEFLLDMANVRAAAVDWSRFDEWGLPGEKELSPASMATDEYKLVRAGAMILDGRKDQLGPGFSFAFARPLFIEWGVYRAFGERVRRGAAERGLQDCAAELEQLLTMPPAVGAAR
ncbi:MAG: serine/threonine-protein kinase, partial [Phycisphaerales bacterium]